MNGVRTVNLEIVRHGPAHNQLLSPLTRYIGICGPNDVSSITVELEHWKLNELLTRLSYRRSGMGRSDAAVRVDNSERRHVLEEISATVTKILSANPGLVVQLKGGENDTGLVELRLVISATELALLPFELSRIPAGFPGGAENWLGLQSRYPVCITRSMRSLRQMHCNWRQRPRILFIAAGVPSELIRAHLRAFVKILAPWLPLQPHNATDDAEKIDTALAGHIVVLTDASLGKISNTCRDNRFTHVHVLAHGIADPERPGKPIGLLLHGRSPSRGEVVSGRQLVSALAGSGDCAASRKTTLPNILTLAGCGSAHAGHPVYSHGSLAHVLHESGISVVIASQFPLSFRGSIFMLKSLYHCLLRGIDPRIALHNTRVQLHARCSGTRHDWASLVGYVALPPDFSEQLVDFRYMQAKYALDNALQALDEKSDENITVLEELLSRVDNAEHWLPDDPAWSTEVMALKAAIAKRKAQVSFRMAQSYSEQDGSGRKKEKWSQESTELLVQAVRLYEQAARESVQESVDRVRKKRALHWSLTQYLCLRAVLCGIFDDDAREKWAAAMYSARVDREAAGTGSEFWIWAAASEMELYLLRYGAWKNDNAGDSSMDGISEKKARTLAHQIHLHGGDCRPVRLTCYQLQRYVDWWQKMDKESCPEGGHGKNVKQVRESLAGLAEELSKILEPETPSCRGNDDGSVQAAAGDRP